MIDPRDACLRKKRYPTKREARAACVHLRSTSAAPRGETACAFCCPVCGGWHVGRNRRGPRGGPPRRRARRGGKP